MPLPLPPFLEPLLAQPAAILGGGASGWGAASLFTKIGAKSVVFDEKSTSSGVVNNFGPSEAARHRLVVFSPGFAPGHPWLAAARAAGCACLPELDLAALCWRGAVVAVTGTNGKTTLTEFLTHALRTAGETAFATGNIGDAFSALAADADGGSPRDTAVCEVSSFQAETLQHFRADATLWTNFAEDHLERHAGMEDYFAAKARLVQRTAPGALFAGSSVCRYAAAIGRPLPSASCIVSEGKQPDPRLLGTVFQDYPQLENYILAEAWWRHTGRHSEVLLEAARTFAAGPHRMARVGEFEGVTWWNDSKATNFHAVEAALRRFSQPVYLIAGGKSKGGDVDAFVGRIARQVRRLYAIGETGGTLARAGRAHQVDVTACSDLAEAVRRAAAAATPGDNVLLSPGFASFDQFQGYADRGRQFENHVNNLGIKANFR